REGGARPGSVARAEAAHRQRDAHPLERLLVAVPDLHVPRVPGRLAPPDRNRVLHRLPLAQRDPLPPPAPLPGPSDWPSQGRDPDNSRLNANEAAITRGNAASLAPAWNFHTPRAVRGAPCFSRGTSTWATGAAPSTASTRR